MASLMPPNQQQKQQQRLAKTDNHGAWPTVPGSSSPHIQIPPAPTMNDIQEAFAECSEATAEDNNQSATPDTLEIPSAAVSKEDSNCNNVNMGKPSSVAEPNQRSSAAATGSESPSESIAAVAVEERTGNNMTIEPNQQSVSATDQSASNTGFAPSMQLSFMGYMDEKGIVHSQSKDTNELKNGLSNGKKIAAARQKPKTRFSKEESPDALSVEDILQASLNFEKTNPEKRFSSSLDNMYASSSSRNLYPSLDDFGERSATASQKASSRETSGDWEGMKISAQIKESIVPEPPGTESFASASAACEDHAVEDEEDVKIGVARAEIDRTDTDSPAYAVAAVDNNVECASAEATVLGTSETPEEALLAKLAADDAELVALKRSAYGGGYEGTPGFQSTASTFAGQEATVVSISEEYHPSEVSENEVRAELIGEDYNGISAIGTPLTASSNENAAAATHVASVGSTSHAAYAVEEQGYAVVDSEATVIYEGENTWQASHAEEATVLNDDMLDRKLPAVSSFRPEQQSTSHRNSTNNGDYSVPYAVADGHSQVEANAVAVTEDSYYEAGPYGNSANIAYSVVDDGASSNVAYATANDTGAYDNSTNFAYADEQAQVVEIREDYHPAEITGNEAQAELVSGAGLAYAAQGSDEQAEVVEISEEYHPAEFLGNEAEAELIAEDYGATVNSSGGADRAQVVEISGDTRGTDSAHANFVGEEYDNSVSQVSNTGVEAAVLPTGVQAATVIGYEDEVDMLTSPGISRANSCGLPVPDRTPPSARAYTAPAAVGTRIDPVNTPLTVATTELDTVVEEDWMRTPTFSGDAGGHQGVVVLQPPVDGDEGQPAVAVASVAAYADAPPLTVDDTSCSSPAATTQPALAVTSINAYASTPGSPEFDDTDCSMINRNAVQPETPALDASTNSAGDQSSELEPAMPPPRSFNSIGNSDAGSVNSATSMSTSTTRAGFQKISNSFARGMEMLFGDTKPSNGRKASDNASLAKSVMPRQLLPWSVIYSEATSMWVATVNTNQKALDSKNVVEASKSLRAFSVVTERQATCLAKAWSPPRMHAFNKNPACHICKAKFAVFRRACHCRNCGVTVCVSSNGCSRPWPAKMCPETYNIKKESFLNVCAACDFLCTEFRLALLEGNRDKAIALHATGNINLVTPFANVKGELFYPVHCAALGGNLELLKWLVDENCCPIKSVRVSGRSRDATNSFTEISTSKGRSLLGIALENRNVGIVRYLIVEKGIQLSGEKDITMDTLCRNLELVLRLLPEVTTGNTNDDNFPGILYEEAIDEQSTQRGDTTVRGLDTASDGSVNDACIICFDHSIDCVATPCGHQVCCLECGRNINRCPVCAAECSFMRVFRP